MRKFEVRSWKFEAALLVLLWLPLTLLAQQRDATKPPAVAGTAGNFRRRGVA